MTCSVGWGLQKLLRLLVLQMLKENLLKAAAGDGGDVVAGGGGSGVAPSIKIS